MTIWRSLPSRRIATTALPPGSSARRSSTAARTPRSAARCSAGTCSGTVSTQRGRPSSPRCSRISARTLYTLASARFDTGQWDEALVTFDRALAAARARGDAVLVEEVLAERRYCRAELGLPPDEDDAMTPDPSPHPEEIAVALAWFPRDEHAEALRRWPELGEDLADPDAYCAAMEARLREISAATARNPAVAPLRVAALAEFADERGLDPDSGEARSQWAAELQRRGEAIAWPPGRNEPCWCGSERKYKRCCGGRGR